MNTQTGTENEIPAVVVRGNGPGGQLRQARLDLKLAPEDVAHILHLSSRQIVALEDDDYENLPGPTYVRGYLRGYAQLLGLPAEPVVEAYNRLVASRKPVDLGKLAPKAEIRSDHQLIKFATVAVIAIVLGLSAVWWREPERPAVPSPAREARQQTTAVDEPLFGDETSTPVAAGENPILAVVPAPDATRTPAPTKPAVTAPPRTPVPAATVAPNNGVAPPVISPPTSPAVMSGPRARLVFQAQLDSWADVRDAQGNRLLYETIQAGRSVTVEGSTPLSVFLGNADGVRMEYNGQPYDISRHKRGEFARFTLGEPPRTP